MRIALVNPQTNIVENLAVAPEGTNIWFAPAGKIAVPSNSARIGDTYDPATQRFTTPAPPVEDEPPAEPEAGE